MNVKVIAKELAVASNTEICDVDVENFTSFAFRVKNAGGFAFDAFIISGKFHKDDAAWTVLASVAGDYSGPNNYPVKKTVGTPVTLAALAEAWLHCDVTFLHRIRVEASSNGTITTADLTGICK